MRELTFKILIATTTLCVVCGVASAQRFPERRFVRSGNSMFEKQRYAQSEVSYRRALEKSPQSYEGAYNLAGALYKQERYGEAAELYSQLAADSSNTDNSARTLYNSGNALFKERQLEQALQAYKSSLRLNPNDQQAKFNLAYTQKLLDENKNKDKNKDNKDNKKDQQQKQDQQKQDQQKQDQKNNKDPQQKPNDPQKKPNPEQPQPQQGGVNKQEADRMLEAVQMSEDKTREKMQEKQAKVVGRSGKNW